MKKTNLKSNKIKVKANSYPYVISVKKLLVLSFLTLGFYDHYWFYKQWKSFSKKRHTIFVYIFLAVFSPITSFFLFSRIETRMRLQRANFTLDESKGRRLSVLYFFLNMFSNRLPEGWGYLYLFRVIALIQVQIAINSYWEKEYGESLVKSPFGLANYIWSAAGLLLSISLVFS